MGANVSASKVKVMKSSLRPGSKSTTDKRNSNKSGSNNSTDSKKRRKSTGDLLYNPMADKLRMNVIDEDTIKISISGDIYKCPSSGVENGARENHDIHRCFFVNPSDKTYLVLQLGAYAHHDVCIMKLGNEARGIHKLTPSPQQINVREETNKPTMNYVSWLETEVNEIGVPKGKLIWRGELTLPSHYFPAGTQLYSLQTLSKSKLRFNTGVPSIEEFGYIGEIMVNTELLSENSKYSQIWLDHLPVT